MGILTKAAAAVMAATLVPAGAAAQTWSREQTEVWQYISSIWERHNQTNTWHETLDPAGYGWWTTYPVPSSRETLARRFRLDPPAGKVIFYRIDPLAITVSGDTAMAFYFAQEIEADPDEKRHNSTSRCTDTLIRRSGQWRVLGWFCDKKSS